jgi:hypothetical protein
MGTDWKWVAVDRAVQEAFADSRVQEDPPRTPEDWEGLAATVTDHLCAMGVVALEGDRPDAVRRRLQALAEEMRRELSGVADIRAEGPVVELRPKNERAVGVVWFDTGEELQVQTLGGGSGGRWELGRDEADAAFVEEAARAVVAGQVREVFGARRSAVTLTLADGRTASETGYGPGLSGCLPSFGWRRRGRVVQYEPYRLPVLAEDEDVAEEEVLGQSDFCRLVEQQLHHENPRLTVSVHVERQHFVIRMTRGQAVPRTWRWPVDEGPYDPELTQAWTRRRARYLAVLAAEDNTDYVHAIVG